MSTERQLEGVLLAHPQDLKYTLRPDLRDKAALGKSFRAHFEALNHVKLTDAGFDRILGVTVTPDVFAAAHTLRHRNSLTRDDGTLLNYTLVKIADRCKNTFEVVHQIRIKTDNSHHRTICKFGMSERPLNGAVDREEIAIGRCRIANGVVGSVQQVP